MGFRGRVAGDSTGRAQHGRGHVTQTRPYIDLAERIIRTDRRASTRGRHVSTTVNAILADDKAKGRFTQLGASLLPGSVADFGTLLADETEKWGRVVKFSGAKPE